MSDRDEILTYLGLPASATFAEIEHAYIVRCNSAGERLVAGDESARAELATLKDVFGRLSGRTSEQLEESLRAFGVNPAPAELHLRSPAWWKCYLSLLVALASVTALAALGAYLPHVYHKGGILIPLALIVSAALLSIVATMLSEGELQRGRRARVLRSRGLERGGGSAFSRFQAARAAAALGRVVRWLTAPALIVTVFLNFASLSGRWSIRN
ncbi:MAG: hypothetical protein ACYDHO_07520 [Gaiellaceae bacterium]